MAYGENQLDGYTEGEDEIVFHYKKGSFRNVETDTVKNLATGKTKTSPGLIKALVSNRGNKFMFFTLIAVVAFAFVFGILTGGDDHDLISGTNCIVSAFSFEDSVYSTVEVKKAKKDTGTSPVLLTAWFEAVNIEGSVAAESEAQSIIFECNESAFIRTVFRDYDIAKVRCHISDGNDTIVIECKVTRK